MNTIDQALTAFQRFKERYNEYLNDDLTESDTRSKLIDEMFINVLGWDEEDIIREGYGEHGYYDYRISFPGFTFLVEAKKKFNQFILPSKHSHASLNSLFKGNSDVITQIRNYSMDAGVSYGVITNGFQYILAKFINTDGTDWRKNSALLFKDLGDIESRFIDFFENLSKNSLIHNGGVKYDLTANNVQGKTILSTLVDKDKELVRTSLTSVLTPIVENVFGALFSEERDDNLEFIKKCFVENAETKKNKSEIERLFSDNAPQINAVIPIVNSQNLASSILKELTSDEISNKNSIPPNPIIIIGSKGAGKTTFINHLFKYRFEGEELEHHFVVYIDFRKFFESEITFDPTAIAIDILEVMMTKYEALELHSLSVLKRIYFKEIKRNDESVWSYDKSHNEQRYQERLSEFLEIAKQKPLDHLAYLSKYLIRERRKRLIVIIDNADQFNDETQKQLFLFSHSLSKSALCGTVISLREGYYRKWQNSPPFDAYDSNIYHITAPRYLEILQKRLEYAIAKTREDQTELNIEVNGRQLKITPNYVVEYLIALQDSLFALENSSLIDFMSLTTFPDIREGLRVFKVFISSGHTKISEYIERLRQRNAEVKRHSVIPIHEFIKSIALQNRHYYKSEISIIVNLFQPVADSNDHFLKIYVLKHLSELIENHEHPDRFVSNEDILNKFISYGYKSNEVNQALFSLIKNAMIDTDEQLSDISWKELPLTYNIRLTSKGYYYFKELIYRFHYYDLIFQDTPIYLNDFFERLRYLFPESSKEGQRNFELRKQFVNLFFEYLLAIEQKQPSQLKIVFGEFIQEIRKKVNEEIDRMN